MLIRCITLLFLCWVMPVMAQEGRYQIDTENSYIRVLTDKSGIFGAMAHYHVVTINSLSGEVQTTDEKTGQVSLSVSPEDFLLDDDVNTKLYPELFKKPVKDSAVEGTRKNMLGKKLFDIVNFPDIDVMIAVADISLGDVVFDVTLQVRGQKIELQVPGKLVMNDGKLHAEAKFTTSNPELGLPVFKALAGSIAVGKKLEFEVNVVATSL